ncbi:hypothetical protein BHC44_08935 [Snodgrassella alvi]|uniref:Uncharacterized protein n=1 Tax=Snodgrassella alvi TaxID=1196083 RepID=A0A2N9XWK0_9NEIS|nr:hypothetical protein [Snodgrassella alvi]PIT52343.1 hypothetical protein BHC44_08935 [Snodgrassella alvi]PIT54083.1 hypothetical protein BHC49_09045 [Snodgrassella alvi]
MQVENKFRVRYHDEIASLMDNAELLAIIQDIDESPDETLERISRKDLGYLSEYCFHVLDTTTFIMETLSKLVDSYRDNNITKALSQEDFLRFTSTLTALSGGINSCIGYMHPTIMELLGIKRGSTSS